MTQLNFESINATFAREVANATLWADIEPLVEPLRNAFCEHPVLVFRHQALGSAHLLALGRALGTPARYIEKSWWTAQPEISNVSNMRDGNGAAIGGLSSRELNWHTDQSYNAAPVTGCYLYAQVVPDAGGKTSWANLYGAYAALPTKLRNVVDNAVGTFSYAARTGAVIPNADADAVQQSYVERIRTTPDVKHPLVNTNPATGAKALYIDPGTLVAIDGMSTSACQALTEELLHYATLPRNIYQHDWEVGDLVLWDNAATLHQRDPFPNDQCRLLRRMILDLPRERHIFPSTVN